MSMNRAEMVHGICAGVGSKQVGAFRSVGAWILAESGEERMNGVSGDGAKWNPLNVAGQKPPPGCTPYNTFAEGTMHVWNYPTYLAGVNATVAVLKQDNMAAVLTALRQDGVSAEEVLTAVGESPWGTSTEGLLATLATYQSKRTYYNGLLIGP